MATQKGSASKGLAFTKLARTTHTAHSSDDAGNARGQPRGRRSRASLWRRESTASRSPSPSHSAAPTKQARSRSQHRSEHCSRRTRRTRRTRRAARKKGEDDGDDEEEAGTHAHDQQHECAWPGCHKVFARRHHLTIHMRRHQGVKPFQCDQCGKGFVQSGDRKRHLLTHSQVKAHVCPRCHKHFQLRSSLLRHLKTHEGSRPHACPWPGCDYRCIQAHDLKCHMRKHTKEKPFECEHCGRKYGHKKGLLYHIAKQHAVLEPSVAPARSPESA